MAKQGGAGLSLWDRLVLLVAWAVTCGLVYLLGFYVGKGTQERRLGLEERIVRLPVTAPPPAAGQRPATGSDLTFYDTLVSGQKAENRADAPPARPAAPLATEPRAASSPQLAVGPPPTAPPRPAGPVRPAPPVVVPAAPPASPEAAKVAVRPVAPPTTAPPPAAAGGWTVVADLTRSRDEAEALQRQLRGHGYDAAVVRVTRDGDTWYRVRVGRFGTSAQADEMRQRLREREGVAHVFVASE